MDWIILFDTPEAHGELLPLSYTRPIADFRIGILTIREKWELRLPDIKVGALAPPDLRAKFPFPPEGDDVYVDATFIAGDELVETVMSLRIGEALYYGDKLVAFRGARKDFETGNFDSRRTFEGDLRRIEKIYTVFLCNADEICADYKLLTSGRKSLPVPDDCLITGSGCRCHEDNPDIFIEEGAQLSGCTLNPSGGPIFIARNAEIMEGACLRGPISVGSHSKVNMGTKIYGGTTIGPWCKVGGELNNAVIFGYSNKAHDGFLGNAVVGEWCNIGAGTNASNLKNDYTKVRVWNYPRRSFLRTDLQFCGLIMGDHSKAGINCMFNTATVVGVGVNFYGSGYPRPFIPSFSKGSCAGFTDVDLRYFFDVASKAMARRGVELTEEDKRMFENIFVKASEFK